MNRAFCPSRASFALLALLLIAGRPAFADVVDFEDLAYASGFDYENGAHLDGSFQSGGATFQNQYYPSYDGWGGFAYSRVNDTVDGFPNQYAAITGTGRGGSGNYGVATGYDDRMLDPSDPDNPVTLGDLQALPNFSLPDTSQITGLYVTNTTYAYNSITQGDSFGSQPFGGADGTAPDFFLLTAYGTDANDNILSTSVDFYLADYRSSNSADDYVVTDWRFLDLSTLNGATHVYFNLSGSQVGDYGLNTPAYFAVDDIQFQPRVQAVPEPTSLAACAIGLAIVGAARRRRSGANNRA